MDNEQRCGTCKWWKNSFEQYGDCTYAMPEWVVILLKRVHYNTFPNEVLGPSTTMSYEGKDCPTWHAKQEKRIG